MASNRVVVDSDNSEGDGADNGTWNSIIVRKLRSVVVLLKLHKKKKSIGTDPHFIWVISSRRNLTISARCNYCPKSASTVKTNANNTTVLDSHLKRNHRAVYEQFLIKKAEVKEKRKEIKEGFKREMGHDLFKT